MEFLQDNILVGEAYDGELLEKISEMDMLFLEFYLDKVKPIDPLGKIQEHEWLCDSEKKEIEKAATILIEKYNSNRAF